MALRIGKKKDASNDDWSESTLLGATDDTSTPAPATATTPTTAATTEPADTFVADNFAPAAPPRKSLSPVLLAAGLVLLLTAVGVGAYFLFFNTPAEDTTAPPVVPAPRVATAPDAPPDAAPPAAPPEAPVAAPAAKPTPRKIAVKPARNEPLQKVKPGKAGLIPPNTKTPAVRPMPNKPPAVAPKPNQPTPVPIMPDGVAGQRGKGLRPGTTVPVVQPRAALTPALMAQLKTLWQQGAAAKHRGDYAAARRAWTRMLQLHPGHPGVQEAINKLPQ